MGMFINQKNSSKLCFGVRMQNSESRRGIKISSKKILTSDYCILYSRYLAALLRGSSLFMPVSNETPVKND